MKHLILLGTLILICSKIFGQDNNCYENSTGIYWPIKARSDYKYKSGNDVKLSKFNGDSIELDGKYYLIEIEIFKSGKTSERYWREENGSVFNHNKEKKLESMELPSIIKLGTTWKSTDKTWTYEIMSLTSSYSTPFCNFDNLLEVKAESSERVGIVYNLFYKQGVGMIGLNVNGNPYTYIMPIKDINERSFIAYGCEKAGSEIEIQSCTYTKIFQHIKENYNAPKKVKKGKMIFRVIIGKQGDIEDVKVIQTIPNAEKQELEAIRVIKSLPKLIPAQIDDNQPIRASFTIPFDF
jgi:hypothetical protein